MSFDQGPEDAPLVVPTPPPSAPPLGGSQPSDIIRSASLPVGGGAGYSALPLLGDLEIDSAMDDAAWTLLEHQLRSLDGLLLARVQEAIDVLQWYRRLFSRRFEGYLRLEELDSNLEELRAYLMTIIEHRQGVGSVLSLGGFRSLAATLLEAIEAIIRVFGPMRTAAMAPKRTLMSLFSSQPMLERPSVTAADVPPPTSKAVLGTLETTIGLVAVVKSKLRVICGLQERIFAPVDELYSRCPNELVGRIHGLAHLGFDYDRVMYEYARRLKTVYCTISEAGAQQAGLLTFSANFPKYYLAERQANLLYEELRERMDVTFLAKVWNLLEDPVIAFFATTFGVIPRVAGLAVNHDVILPTPLPSAAAAASAQEPAAADAAAAASSAQQQPTRLDVRCRLVSAHPLRVDPALIPDAATAAATVSAAQTPLRANAALLPDERWRDVVVLHLHGGGWVSQSPGTHMVYLAEWVKRTRLPLVSVDYRLAPAAKFPYQLDECYAVYRWLLEPANARRLGLPIVGDRPLRLLVAGDSAGGNLACGVTLRALADGLPLPLGLLLTYPATNLCRDGSIARLIFIDDPILNYQTMNIVLDSYLAEAAPRARTDPLISPVFASDEQLAAFPPTVVVAGDVDPLIDDATYFYERLRRAGARCRLKLYRRLPHGHLNLPSQLPHAVDAINDDCAFMAWLCSMDDQRRAKQQQQQAAASDEQQP